MDSIIFDLDGTLWDSTKNLHEVWNETFYKYGLGKPFSNRDVPKYMGATTEDFVNDMPHDIPIEERFKIAEESWNSEIPYLSKHGGILYDDVENTLKVLSEKYKLFIVSNCMEGYIQAFFSAHGLEKYFCDIEYIGRTGLEKSENIKLIIKRNNLHSPVYVGDTQRDMLSSKEAGIPFIFAAYGFGESKDYLAKIDKFSELPLILEKI